MDTSKSLDHSRDFHSFAKLTDVDRNLSFRVSSLLGNLPRKSRTQLLDCPELNYFGAQQSSFPDLSLSFRLYADNKPLTSIYKTSYKPFKNNHQWSEWFTLPWKICDLPLNSQLAFTVYDVRPACYQPQPQEKGTINDEAVNVNGDQEPELEQCSVIGGTCFKLFGKKGTLKKAQHRLLLWPGVKGDGSVESTTPSKIDFSNQFAQNETQTPNQDQNQNGVSKGERDEMGRLEKLIKRHERSDLPRLSWLDKLVYRRIEKINSEESLKSDRLFLYIDMPRFDLPIVFCEKETQGIDLAGGGIMGMSGVENAGAMVRNPNPKLLLTSHNTSRNLNSSTPITTTTSTLTNTSTSTTNANANATLNVTSPKDQNQPPSSSSSINQNLFDKDFFFTIVDEEIYRENPVESKHRKLVRSHRNGPLDRELKPNAAVRDELNEILSYPPTRILSASETDRIWSFRFYLTRDPKGLTKFLKSVVWSDPVESKQATEVLLPMWNEPGLDDALELLGPAFKDRRVRQFAVKLLQRAEDEELILYLLQLVQALKFDSFSSSSSSSNNNVSSNPNSEARSKDPNPSSFIVDPAISPSKTKRNPPSSTSSDLNHLPTGQGTESESESGSESRLTEFLIARSLKNPILANQLYWYLEVECEDESYGRMYRKIKARFWERLADTPNGANQRELFTRQAALLSSLSSRAKELRSSKDSRPKKIEKLRSIISDPKNGLACGKLHPPIPLPLDARIKVTGIRADKSTVFKSNLFPLLLHFETHETESTKTKDGNAEKKGKDNQSSILAAPFDSVTSSLTSNSNSNSNHSENSEQNSSSSTTINATSSYSVIFKNGDDLRQDQLVIQLFTLMDRLLRNENLDLKITPYKVLATGSLDGMVQFVPSLSIAAIMNSFGGSLLNYLRHHHPDETSIATYGVKPNVLDTFVRSCAGYCVVTYLLGVGDRHLDNLLLSPDGHFFHVDFGYILGRDPKPFPPPVKVCKEMIDGMGGSNSIHYKRFKSFCFTAFISLRKSANLILNLIALMVDANVPDIKVEPDKAVFKVQEKFRLDLSEDEAIQHFEALLNETSYLSAVFDRIHDVAQYFRQ